MPMVPDVNTPNQSQSNPLRDTTKPSQANTKHQTNQPNQTTDRSGAAAVTHPKYHSIIQESRTAHHRSQSRLSSYPPTRGVNQLIEVDHPVRGPPCLPSHQSTRAGTQLHQLSGPSRVAQGPLANTRSSRDEHHGPPTVSARPRRSWFNDKAQNTDG